MILDEQRIHELAVAFAQAKLIKANMEEKTLAGHSPFSSDYREIEDFIKAYRFALDNIEFAWNELD